MWPIFGKAPMYYLVECLFFFGVWIDYSVAMLRLFDVWCQLILFCVCVQWTIEMANYEWVDVWCGVVQEVQRVLWRDTGRAGQEVMGLAVGPWKMWGVWVWSSGRSGQNFYSLPFVSILPFYHKYILLLLKEIIDGIWYLGITRWLPYLCVTCLTWHVDCVWSVYVCVCSKGSRAFLYIFEVHAPKNSVVLAVSCKRFHRSLRDKDSVSTVERC